VGEATKSSIWLRSISFASSPWQKEIILRRATVHAFSVASEPCFISSLGLTPNFENACTGVRRTSATGC
jgi:hypothetical protein